MFASLRLNLVPFTIEMLHSIKAGPAHFYSKFGIILPVPFTEFPESIDNTLNQLKENTPGLAQSYAIIIKNSFSYIGQIGFFTPPDENGSIELGYEITHDFRGRGYADEAVKKIIQIAFDSTETKSIIAHTLPINNASSHLLIKNHFIYEKKVLSPEDGILWQWKLTKKLYLLKQMF